MEEYTNAWNHFFETGNIYDYLQAKQIEQTPQTQSPSDTNASFAGAAAQGMQDSFPGNAVF